MSHYIFYFTPLYLKDRIVKVTRGTWNGILNSLWISLRLKYTSIQFHQSLWGNTSSSPQWLPKLSEMNKQVTALFWTCRSQQQQHQNTKVKSQNQSLQDLCEIWHISSMETWNYFRKVNVHLSKSAESKPWITYN